MQKNNKPSKLILLPQNSSFFPLSLTNKSTTAEKFYETKAYKNWKSGIEKKIMFTCHNGTYCLILLYYILQLSLSIFTQKYLLNCKDTYFILQNKFLRIYEDIFGAKIIRVEDIIFSYRPSTSAGDLSSTNKIKEEEEKLYYNNTFWHLCILVCARGL